ncbi:uncharacterized protein LOC103524116 [Trichonephila clavipes]|nr:uncharacterized protein LOC103524116 [Trichonephila clavipes]
MHVESKNCRELLGKIKGKIVFQWVPSHCGLWGNERADFLAKKGTGILQNFRRDLTLHSAKPEIKRIFRESFHLTASRVARDKPWSTLCKKSHGTPSSRAAAVAKFRLLTGHDCLCAHLFRFNLVTSPICVLCDTGQDMTAAHLDECSALNDLNCIVKRSLGLYWRKPRVIDFPNLFFIPISYHSGRFSIREKGGNRLVPGTDYMVDALKLSNQAPKVSGESLQTCVAWRCPDGTQHLFCWPILAVSSQSLASNCPVIDSRDLKLVFGHTEAVQSFQSHQIHSRTFLDVSPGLATV